MNKVIQRLFITRKFGKWHDYSGKYAYSRNICTRRTTKRQKEIRILESQSQSKEDELELVIAQKRVAELKLGFKILIKRLNLSNV